MPFRESGAGAALLILAAFALPRMPWAQPAIQPVTLKEGAYDWKTWDIAERADHGVSGQNLGKTVTRNFKTLVLENEFLAVTVLPGYGARILSIFNKATGHEELFQNPVGYADGIGAGNFYYNWLMVLGGIFPTFPEPEHGKTYLLPWKSEVTAEGPDKVSVSMSLTDDIDFPGHPGRFAYGVTGLTCIVTVTLEAGKSAVEMKVQLKNAKAQSVRYEYWTCHSLAPGSTPGDTKSPKSTEIVVPIEKYSVGYGTAGIDRAVDGGQEYKNLAFFRNWKGEGIAYAEPAVTKKWWGVINHDNGEGIFRIVDDPKQTPGLKFWTWGYRDGYAMASPARQFIELWAGAGHKFFSPAQIPATTTRSWTETYIPTLGLKAVTLANENALVSLQTDKAAYDGAADKNIAVTADIVSSAPGAALRAIVSGGTDGMRVLLDTTFRPAASKASHIALTRPLGSIGPGKQTVTLRLLDPQGAVLLEAGAAIGVTNVTLGLPKKPERRPSGFSLRAPSGGGLVLAAPDPGLLKIRLYDFRGRLIRSQELSGTIRYVIPMRPGHAVAGARILHGGRSQWVGLEVSP
jgi:hypothetical protein